MKRMPFEPPTEHYDVRIAGIDEQICDLIKQRKDISNNNPGFPTENFINTWSEKYDFYEGFLNGIFDYLLNEEVYGPYVEPKRFIKNIPVLKYFEKDDYFYTVTFIRQYENASVVHLNMDRDTSDETPEDFHQLEHPFFELSIEVDGFHYDCRNDGGGGSDGHSSYSYIISPPLPDDFSGHKLIFKQYKVPFKKTSGLEFIIKMD